MNKTIRKVLVACLAGVLALNTIPVRTLINDASADEAGLYFAEEFGDVSLDLKDTTLLLTLVKGSHYFNGEEEKILFNDDATFKVVPVSKETGEVAKDVEVSSDDAKVEKNNETGSIFLSEVKTGAVFNFKDLGSVTLSDFFDGLVVNIVEGTPSISDFKYVPNGNEANGYISSKNTAKFTFKYVFPEGLSESDCYCRLLTDNDNIILNSSIGFDSETGTGNISINLSDSEGFTGAESEYELALSIKDSLGGSSSVLRSTFKVDGKSPKLEDAGSDVVISNGETYLTPDEDGAVYLRFKVSDGGSGVKSVTSEIGSIVAGDDSYILKITETGKVTPEVKVVDGVGNTATYKLSDFIEGASNEATIETPEKAGTIELIDTGGYKKGTVLWHKDLSSVDFVINDGVATDVKAFLNGNIIEVTPTETGYTTNLEGIQEGVNQLKIVAEFENNLQTELLVNLGLDTSAPELIGVEKEGYLNDFNGAYYSHENVTISLEVTDNTSGVGNVEVLKDGEVFSEGTEFIMSESASYKVKLYDNVGNVNILTLGELFGDGDYEDFILSSEVPEVNISLSGFSNISDGVEWYSYLDKVGFTVKSDAVARVNVSLNGEDYDYAEADNGRYTVSLKNKQGLFELEIEAVGANGLSGKEKVTFGIDKKAPELLDVTVNSLDGSSEDEGVLYVKDDLVLSATPFDEGSGVRVVNILKDGILVSNAFPYVIEEDGAYSVEMIDKVGNMATYSLAQLVDMDFERVCIVKTPIDLVLEDLTGVLIEGVYWYSELNELLFNVESTTVKELKGTYKDSEGTHDLVITDKGKGAYSVSLEDLKEGVSEIILEALDKNGTSDKEVVTVGIDSTSPEIKDIGYKADNPIKEFLGIGYTMSSVVLEGTAFDSGSGIASLEITKNGSVVGNSLPYSISDTGLYGVKITDKVGNVSEYSLKDFLNQDIGLLIISSKVPEVSFEDTEGYVAGDTVWHTDLDEVFFSVDAGNINTISAKVNDEDVKVTSLGEDRYSIKLNNLSKGVTTITVSVEDKNSATATEVFKVGIDNEKPVLNATLEDSNDIYVYQDETTAYAGSILTLAGSPSDELSGVASLEIMRNGKVVGTELPYEVKESGTYLIVVKDNVGNTIRYPLSHFAGFMFSDIVISLTKPEIEVEELGGAEHNGVYWYSEADELSYTVKADNLNKTNVKVFNGDDTYSLTPQSEDGKSFVVSLKNLQEGVNNILITAEDKNGKSVETRVNVGIDTVNPELKDFSVEDKNNIYIYDEVGYSFYDITVSGTGVDELSGVDKVEVLLDGEVVGSKLPYTITSTGDYSVKLYDRVGNVAEYGLSELSGLDFGKLVISKNKPKVDITNTNGVDVDGVEWHTELGKLQFTVEADNLHSVSVKVANGEETYDLTPVSEEGNKYFVSVKELKEGINKITVTAKDKNNQVSSDNVNIGIDKTNPKLVDYVVDGKEAINVYDKIGYSFKDVKVSGNGVDSLSGVAKVEVLKNGEVVNNALPYTIVSTGEYTVKVIDNVGNSSTYTLAELSGLDFGKLIISKKVPVLSVDDTNGVDINGVEWHKVLDKLTYKVDADNIKDVFVEVSNGNTVGILESSSEDMVSYTVDTSKLSEGVNTIKVVVTDKNGTSASKTVKIGIDKTNPEITGRALVNDETIYVYDEIGYTYPDVELKGDLKDSLSGVNKVEVYKDGKVVSNTIPYVVSQTGVYTIKITDNVGNVKEYDLDDFTSKSFNKIVVSKSEPVISITDLGEGVDFASLEWYKSLDKLHFNVSADNFRMVEVSVKGNAPEYNLEVTAEKEGFSVPLDKLADGETVITVKAYDKNGTSSKKSIKFGVDASAPTIESLKVDREYKDRNGYLWFDGSPKASVVASDKYTEVVSYTVLNISGESRTVESDTFKLIEGDYAVKVTDSLGNVSEVLSLKEALGSKGDSVVIDTVAPEINCARPEGDVNGWYGKDVTFKANLKDDKGVRSAKISINGEVVDTITTSDIVTNLSIEADTSKVAVNKEDGSYKVKVVVYDNAGNSSEWSDTIFIDRVAPKVNKFVITSEGYKEGKAIEGSDRYGFFLKDAAEVEIYVSDGSISSGMSKVVYTLTDAKGASEEHKAYIKDGVATIKLPENFKGFISAYAVDKVGHQGSVERPDGVVSESGNVHINNSSIKMELPKTEKSDKAGHNLYSENITIKTKITDSISGIREIEWGINEDIKDKVTVDSNGKITGDINKVLTKDKNLVLSLEKNLVIAKNQNNLKVWVKVTDRSGNVSEKSRVISIDKSKPVIKVTYDETNESGYYSDTRVATISVKDNNFDKSKVDLTGTYGKLSSWSYEDGEWVATMVFSANKDYKWGMSCTDRAGNVSKTYNSEKFTVDKVAPEVSLSFDKNTESNYYNGTRTATIVVKERNFNGSSVVLSGKGELSKWSHDGNIHKATVVFEGNGEYSFSVKASDKAGNVSNSVASGKFIIDKENPTIKVNGVSNGVSYKKDVSVSVSIADKYISADKCSATLSGKNIGALKLEGGFDKSGGKFTLQGLPKEKKYDDYYTLHVTAQDKAGNKVSETISFSVNRFGSKYKFVNEHLLGNVVNEVEDIKLKETSVDRLNLKDCKIVVLKDGEKYDVPKDSVKVIESGSDGAWVYTYKVSKEVFTEDGKYQLQVFSKSDDGTKNSSLVQEYSFMLDTTQPEVIVSGVESNGYYKDPSRRVTLDIRDTSGIASIKVVLDGNEIIPDRDGELYSFDVSESDARRDLVVTVVDKAGNEAEVRVSDFLITTDTVQSVMNSNWFKFAVAGIIAISAGLIFALVKRRKRVQQEEQASARETAEMYERSSTGGSGSSNSNDQ